MDRSLSWSVPPTVSCTEQEAVPLFHLPQTYDRNGFRSGLDAGLDANGWMVGSGLSSTDKGVCSLVTKESCLS